MRFEKDLAQQGYFFRKLASRRQFSKNTLISLYFFKLEKY
jgi:hypothetical protein